MTLQQRSSQTLRPQDEWPAANWALPRSRPSSQGQGREDAPAPAQPKALAAAGTAPTAAAREGTPLPRPEATSEVCLKPQILLGTQGWGAVHRAPPDRLQLGVWQGRD